MRKKTVETHHLIPIHTITPTAEVRSLHTVHRDIMDMKDMMVTLRALESLF